METNSLDDPARAFDDLRREVSLALRAIQGLAAEHRDQPDYRDTLKALDDRLAAANKALATIASSPAMRLTPQNLTQEIVKASEQARVADAELLRSAGTTSTALVQQLRLGIAQVRVARDQAIAIRRGNRCWVRHRYPALGNLARCGNAVVAGELVCS